MEHKGLMAELANCVLPVSDISVSVPASSDDETDALANVLCLHIRTRNETMMLQGGGQPNSGRRLQSCGVNRVSLYSHWFGLVHIYR